jgi:hypothetical protein
MGRRRLSTGASGGGAAGVTVGSLRAISPTQVSRLCVFASLRLWVEEHGTTTSVPAPTNAVGFSKSICIHPRYLRFLRPSSIICG